MNKLTLLTVVVFLTACSTSSHILTGEKRPKIKPSQVTIYTKPPSTYFEEVAIISSSSKNSWTATDQGKLDKVVERLKEEAASLGANGVIIQNLGEQSGMMAGAGSSAGAMVLIPTNHKYGQGMAIYVGR